MDAHTAYIPTCVNNIVAACKKSSVRLVTAKECVRVLVYYCRRVFFVMRYWLPPPVAVMSVPFAGVPARRTRRKELANRKVPSQQLSECFRWGDVFGRVQWFLAACRLDVSRQHVKRTPHTALTVWFKISLNTCPTHTNTHVCVMFFCILLASITSVSMMVTRVRKCCDYIVWGPCDDIILCWCYLR